MLIAWHLEALYVTNSELQRADELFLAGNLNSSHSYLITAVMLMTDVQTKWMLLELELLLIDLAE